MLKPNYIFARVIDVTADFLIKEGIDTLLLDVDNTLSVAHKDKTLREGVAEWLSDMKEQGISLIILSNAKKERAQIFADSIGLPVVGLAAKPLPFSYNKAVKQLGGRKKAAAVIGDQLFTDVLGGRLAGVRTLLVTDITPEAELGFRIKRRLEQIFLKRWKV